VKDRAARLRAAGAAALVRHLAGEVGAERDVLVERGGIGRTGGFTAVRFRTPQPSGEIVRTRIAGHDSRQLIAA
jgi:threonylcarbamoyladenosine tRNA methylthiotransferase MtaB